jgi:NIMA (never in mitosis gene a)-related kinase 2
MSEKEKQQLVSEVNILRELKHPNITRYYDRVIDKESAKLYIVMEYCEGGDLAALIKRQKALLKDCRSKGQESSRSAYIKEEMGWKLLA